MNTRIVRLAITSAIAGVCAVAAVPAAAQDLEQPRRRQGYYITGGLASGPSEVWDRGDAVGLAAGSRLSFRLGQLLTRRFGLGVNIEMSATKKDNISAALFGVGLEANLELVRHLSARAFSGFGALQITDDTDVDKTQRGTYGAQYGIGLAYDWFPRRSDGSGGLAVTPTMDVRLLPGSSAANVAVFVGVEIAWWTGLPRHQLRLPENEAYRPE